MVKVILTSDHCNPHKDFVITCDSVKYNLNTGKLSMYVNSPRAKKPKLYRYTNDCEWFEIKMIDENGKTIQIKDPYPTIRIG